MAIFSGVIVTHQQSFSAQNFSSLNPTQTSSTPNKLLVFLDQHIALTQQTKHPHSQGQTLLKPYESLDQVIVGQCRLDNRKQLLKQLEFHPQTQDSVTNCQLILQAYQKWGLECCNYLNGDFAFAIWDKQSKSLYIGRDPFGTAEVYFYCDQNIFIFSSSLPCILANEVVPKRPNPLVAALSMFAIERADGSMTSYDQIRQIPSAHYLTFHKDKVRLKQYWSLDQISEIRYQNDEDYVEDFLERFGTAVQNRIPANKETGITLSGGVDSGSIASMAAKYLGSQGKRLQAFTAVPKYKLWTSTSEQFIYDESDLAKLTAKHISNISVTSVNAENCSPIAGISKALNILHHPLVAASNCFWLTEIYALMQANNLETVLSGQFGNATISWNGNYSALIQSLLAGKQFGSAGRELRDYRRMSGHSLLTVFKQMLLGPMLPSHLLERRRYRAAGKTPWASSPLNSDFAHGLNLRSVLLEQGAFAFSSTNPDFRRFLLPVGIFAGSAVGASLAAGFGLTFFDPTTDRRVIEFCLGIPESQYIKGGEGRLLIRRAMRGKIPDTVLDNKKFGLQSADLIMRLRASQSEFLSELKRAEQSELCREYLDLTKMKSVFSSALSRYDYQTTLETSQILMRGLLLAKFLQRFD